MERVGGTERGGQHPAPAEGEQVARDDVVEAEHAREHAGHHQHLGHVPHDRGDHLAGQRDDHAIGVRGGGGKRLLGAETGDHQPRGDGVEHADEGHRDVGGPGDGAQGVLGLVAEHGGRLEAEEAQEGEEQPEARRAGEGLDGAEGQRVELPPRGEHAQIDREHGEDLEHQHHAEHLRGEVDRAVPQQAHGSDHHRRDQPPRHGQTGPQREQVPGLHAEVAGHRHGQQHVAEQGDRGGAEAGAAAEAAIHVGVERAGVGHVRGHPGVAHREQQQDQGGGEDHQRRADAPGFQQDQREVRDHHGDGGGRGDDHQDDAGHSQRARQFRGHDGPLLVRRRWCAGRSGPARWQESASHRMRHLAARTEVSSTKSQVSTPGWCLRGQRISRRSRATRNAAVRLSTPSFS